MSIWPIARRCSVDADELTLVESSRVRKISEMTLDDLDVALSCLTRCHALSPAAGRQQLSSRRMRGSDPTPVSSSITPSQHTCVPLSFFIIFFLSPLFRPTSFTTIESEDVVYTTYPAHITQKPLSVLSNVGQKLWLKIIYLLIHTMTTTCVINYVALRTLQTFTSFITSLSSVN